MPYFDQNSTDNYDRARVNDAFHIGIVSGALSVGTTAVIARVGSANYENRTGLQIHNMGNGVIYYGDIDVTTATGTPIYKNQTAFIKAGEFCNIYIISSAADTDTRIIEGA